MNNIYPLSPTFGQLNWNISQDASKTIYNATNYFNSIGMIFEITIIIFFIGNFCRKTSYFRRPYFIILTIGCIVDALPKFQIFVDQYIVKNNVYFYTMPFLTWYNQNFVTLCNLILALNRFSAIMFPLKFPKIWFKKNTTIICIFLILYPFIIHCYNLMPLYYVITRQQQPANVKETEFEYIFQYASDITYAIIATLTGIISAIKLILQNKLKNKDVEKILLAQSIISSVFLIFSTFSAWLASINKYTSAVTYEPEILRLIALQGFFLKFSSLFYSFHHYMGLILLVLMSKNFRTQYLDFYMINYLIPKCINKITPQPKMTTTVITLTNRPHSF